MALDNINDVLLAATFTSDGAGNVQNITFPVSGLPKFNSGNDVQEGAELVYALLDRLQTAVSAGGHSSLGASVANTFNAGALTMNRTFTFSNVLNIGDLSNFDVKPDPSFNAIPTLAFDVSSSISLAEADVEGSAFTMDSLTFTADGVAVGNVATYAFTITPTDEVAGVNADDMEVVYDSGWKLKSKSGATFTQESSKAYKISVTTADTDDVNPIPVIEDSFALTIT